MRTPLVYIAVLGLAACSTSYSVTPVTQGAQEVRFDRGAPTTFADGQNGAVQVTPLGVNDDRRLVFGIAAFNKGGASSNFGIENLALADADGVPIKVFTTAELVHKEKVKAAWKAVALAVSGAAAAYAANANAYSTTNGYISTPYGSASYYSRTYNPALAYAGTAAATAATTYGLVSVKNSLDRSVSNLRGHILQTTTIDSGDSYGGEAISDGLPKGRLPKDIVLTVHWNGDNYSFKYTVAKDS